MSKYQDNWVKEYGLKEEIRYRIYLPYYLIWAIYGILRGYHKLDDFTITEYIGIAKGMCDCRAGRLYR